MVNGQTLAQCMLAVKVGWDSYLQVADTGEELPPILKSQGINVSDPSNDDDDKFIIVSFALRKGGGRGKPILRRFHESAYLLFHFVECFICRWINCFSV